MNYLFFKAPLVRKILSGEKDITRRPVKESVALNLVEKEGRIYYQYGENSYGAIPCSLKIWEKVWVRETWRVGAWDTSTQCVCVDYIADGFARKEWLHCPDMDMFNRLASQSVADAMSAGKIPTASGFRWKHGDSPCRLRPSIHMPRWASRIDLEILSIKVERLLDITEEDAIREGVEKSRFLGYGSIGNKTYREGFLEIWDSIYGNVDKNPWVWRYEFKRIGGENES